MGKYWKKRTQTSLTIEYNKAIWALKNKWKNKQTNKTKQKQT